MTTPLQQQESIVWGTVAFHGADSGDVDYDIETMAAGTNFGNPVSIIDTVQSLAIDGALAARTGWENREFPLRLRIGANDGETLAQVEAELFAQCLLDRPPPIVWTPPLANAAPAVFDVLVADLQRDVDDGWDFDEKWRGYRYWVLTVTALPFARSVDSVVIPALAPPPSPGEPAESTVIDACTTAPGAWTIGASHDPAFPGGTGGPILFEGTLYTGTDFVRAYRTGAVTLDPTQPYLYIDAAATELWIPSGNSISIAGPLVISLDGGGAVTPVAVAQNAAGPGISRYYYDLTGIGSWSTLLVRKDYNDAWHGAGGARADLRLYEVGTTDTLGDTTTSTTRQAARLATVTGSAPTRAAVRLWDATPAALGEDLLVYTCTATDWTPPLRRWMISGGVVTADTSLVSGGSQPLGTTALYRVPALSLAEAAYSLMGRIKCTTAGSLTWQARMVDGDGADTIGSDQVQTGQVTIPVTTGLTASGWAVLDLADRLQLPPCEVETDDYMVELTLSGTADMLLDEAWLIDLDNGALTWLRDADGLTWIEVRSPELGAARPSVFGGTGDQGSKSMCVDFKAEAFGAHRFEPGPLLVFTMCASSLSAQCELEYFPRSGWHPSAADTDPSGD